MIVFWLIFRLYYWCFCLSYTIFYYSSLFSALNRFKIACKSLKHTYTRVGYFLLFWISPWFLSLFSSFFHIPIVNSICYMEPSWNLRNKLVFMSKFHFEVVIFPKKNDEKNLESWIAPWFWRLFYSLLFILIVHSICYAKQCRNSINSRYLT